MTEINSVTHVPRVVFYWARPAEGEKPDEITHVALREEGEVLCGVEKYGHRAPPGGQVCQACETALAHLSVVMGDYPRDTVAEEVPAP